MACKRSAVRSRVAPPRNQFWFVPFFASFFIFSCDSDVSVFFYAPDFCISFFPLPEDAFFQPMIASQNQTQSVELHVIRLSRVPALNNNEIFLQSQYAR